MKTLITLVAAVGAATATLAVPGSMPEGYNQPGYDHPSRDLDQVIVTETGFITLSADGLGIIGTDGFLQVDKPSAGATVRAAYLAAASTGWSYYVIPDGEIQLAGTGVTWSSVIASSINSHNHWADVTGIVAPILNAAGAGITDLALYEGNTYPVDGTALYVIFNDPSTSITRTAVIAFGAQATTGDQFAIGFGQPVDMEPTTVIEMGLAISYGYARGTCQTSYIDVNGQRFTSSAGGNDDGEDDNGALVTVGGVGNSRANPDDPMYNDPCLYEDFTDYDDELYDIASRVNDGDTGMSVTTFNPSGDDNIFAAHILLDFAAVVGEGAVLTPAAAVNCLGETHTVTVTIQDDNGQPIPGREVNIDVVEGPNAGQGSGPLSTNAAGQASFSYTSWVEGQDALVATFYNNAGALEQSNRAIKVWERCDVDAGETAASFALGQNTPNPFNPSTTIRFSMPETGAATLLVHSLTGRLLSTVELGTVARGEHEVLFDGTDLASGIYVYTLRSEFGSLSRKMVLMK